MKETGALAAPVSFMCFSTSCGICPVFPPAGYCNAHKNHGIKNKICVTAKAAGRPTGTVWMC